MDPRSVCPFGFRGKAKCWSIRTFGRRIIAIGSNDLQTVGNFMDRRDFVTGVGVLSLAIATSERAHAVGRSFDPTEMSISALQAAMVSGAASAQTLTAAYLARIARYDRHGPEHRSVLAINSKALADAGSLDREREAGKVRGPLHGIPILLKDNIESRDPLPTTA